MKFRYARHTNDLQAIEQFYITVLGLKVLGGFENHNNYNGIFLGVPNESWHLEFTQSDEKAIHQPDADDLIVFYFKSQQEIDTVLQAAKKQNCNPSPSKNPYWKSNGTELTDPDGFGIILTLEN